MAIQTYQQWLAAVSLVAVGLGLGGCPQSNWGALPDTKAAASVVQTAATNKPATPPEKAVVAYEVCSEVPDWVRPALEDQQQEMGQNLRYGDDLNQDPLRSLAEKFWNQPIISFTTYGLSARTEPINLSGLWTIADEMWSCYEGDRPEAINQGEMAEIWIIGHRIVSLEWSENQYLLKVVPTGQGVQVVQFERYEANEALPLVIVTAEGDALSAVSGDW
ncbi:hypothetical protein [Leptolyngbya sp. PCC 6406]|uniref:hypothetical protein n=1 Tax=Leptolyngbya sp. PCC 6406 TaxID=1173264 RepID=UPI0002AC1DC5|nr:hypothetical protein [Leptolyngbya sp. PCC 6406]